MRDLLQLLAIMAGLCLIGGCAAVEPDKVRVGVEHLSSVTQHFGADRTNVGFQLATVDLEWRPSKHSYIELQEAYIVGANASFGHSHHELFEGRAGLEFDIK